MSRRRRRNKRDMYGIYEIPNYRPVKKKKKKTFSWKNVGKLLIMFIAMILIIYIVSYGVKYSMKRKAYSLYQQGDYESAISMFQEALSPQLPFMDSFNNDVRFYLADCYVATGNYGYACTEYSKIKVWAEKKPDGIKELEEIAYGLQLYAWKDYRNALPVLLEAYENGYSDLVLYVGSCYGQIGDVENMQIYYDVFLRGNAMNSFMYAQYAAMALDEGKLEEAYAYIQAGKQISDQSHIKELLFDEIVYYEKISDFNTAFEKVKAFVEQYPGDIDGKNEYDMLYTRQTVEKR